MFTHWRHVHTVASCSHSGAMFTQWRHVHKVASCSHIGVMFTQWRHVHSGVMFTQWRDLHTVASCSHSGVMFTQWRHVLYPKDNEQLLKGTFFSVSCICLLCQCVPHVVIFLPPRVRVHSDMVQFAADLLSVVTPL